MVNERSVYAICSGEYHYYRVWRAFESLDAAIAFLRAQGRTPVRDHNGYVEWVHPDYDEDAVGGDDPFYGGDPPFIESIPFTRADGEAPSEPHYHDRPHDEWEGRRVEIPE